MTPKKRDPLSSQDLMHHLGKYLIQLQVGDRLASIRTLADTFQTSIGSISNALNMIEENGMVTIDRRGRMGSFLKEKSLSLLWELSETCPIVIGLTPTTNLRYEGLATGIKKVLSAAGIEAYMIFIRGSYTRLNALREERCHVIVTSSFAAGELCGRSEEILLRLPETSFVSGHRVFYRANSEDLSRSYRVAIDRDSIDQARLTEMEFAGSDVEFVPVTYTQIHRLLKEGHIDAAVWTVDDMMSHTGSIILDRPLSDDVIRQVKGKDTSAVLIGRAREESVRAVIHAAIRPDELIEIQDKVLAGQILPEY